MEPIKVRRETTAALVLGIVFTFLGLFLLLLGQLLGRVTDPVAMIAVSAMGTGMLALGIVFLLFSSSRVRQQQKAVDAGRFVWGQIQGFERDNSIYVNGRSPIRVLVSVPGSGGISHVYRSNASWKVPPMDELIGTQLKIYGPDLKHPYVDLSPLEQQIVQHF